MMMPVEQVKATCRLLSEKQFAARVRLSNIGGAVVDMLALDHPNVLRRGQVSKTRRSILCFHQAPAPVCRPHRTVIV